VTKISYCIPCYRSANTIETVINEIIAETAKLGDYDYEIVLADDNSPDNVFEVICKCAERDKNIKAVQFARNFGQQAGLIATARYATGDIVVFLDDDGQCPMNRITELIAPLENGYDISMAKYGGKTQSWFKNLGSKINDATEVVMTNKPKGLYASNFLAVKKFVVDEMCNYSGPYPYFTGLLLRISNKAVNVDMEDRNRLEGGTTYTFRKLVSTWINGFTNFSIKPLRFATVIGSLLSFGGLVEVIVLIFQKLIRDDITDGWTSIMCAILIIGGLVLVVLGIIGEYIGRIYMTINETPQYSIRNSVNIPDLHK